MHFRVCNYCSNYALISCRSCFSLCRYIMTRFSFGGDKILHFIEGPANPWYKSVSIKIMKTCNNNRMHTTSIFNLSDRKYWNFWPKQNQVPILDLLIHPLQRDDIFYRQSRDLTREICNRSELYYTFRKI